MQNVWLTKLFFLLTSLQTSYCVHSWSACESTSRQRVIYNPQSPKTVHMYLCIGAAQRTSGNCVSSFVCSWGLLAKLLVKHFGQMGERAENMCPPPTSLIFFVSLPFWGEGSLSEPHTVAPSWPLRKETRTLQHWFPSFCSVFLEVKQSIGPSIQHPPGLFGFWPAAVGGVGPLNTTVWGESDGVTNSPHMEPHVTWAVLPYAKKPLQLQTASMSFECLIDALNENNKSGNEFLWLWFCNARRSRHLAWP